VLTGVEDTRTTRQENEDQSEDKGAKLQTERKTMMLPGEVTEIPLVQEEAALISKGI